MASPARFRLRMRQRMRKKTQKRRSGSQNCRRKPRNVHLSRNTRLGGPNAKLGTRDVFLVSSHATTSCQSPSHNYGKTAPTSIVRFIANSVMLLACFFIRILMTGPIRQAAEHRGSESAFGLPPSQWPGACQHCRRSPAVRSQYWRRDISQVGFATSWQHDGLDFEQEHWQVHGFDACRAGCGARMLVLGASSWKQPRADLLRNGI